MTVQSSTPTLADVFAQQLRAFSDGLRVALPAEVLAWSTSEPELARVQPTVRLRERRDGALISYRPAAIKAPVSFPGSGGYSMTWPLQPGDTGLLVFADRSLDEWVEYGNPDSDPRSQRRHAYADGVFIPGARPTADYASNQIDGSAMTIAGQEIKLGNATASDFVALASLVEAQLEQINVAVAAAVTAIAALPVGAADSGAAGFSALQGALSSWPLSVASSRVRSL